MNTNASEAVLLRGVCVRRAIMCRLCNHDASTSRQLPAGYDRLGYVTVRQGLLAGTSDAVVEAKPTATLRRKKAGKAR